jgi:hypothetical protein
MSIKGNARCYSGWLPVLPDAQTRRSSVAYRIQNGREEIIPEEEFKAMMRNHLPMSNVCPDVSIEIPEKLAGLFEPHPYKVLYGGRDGVKSWSVAQALLILGTKRPLRILCARETMDSIRESVHQTLTDRSSGWGWSASTRLYSQRSGARTGQRSCSLASENRR